MKRYFLYITAFAAMLLTLACTQEILTPDQSKLPVASELTEVITVDQTTNYVTFSVEDKGVVPIWIFGSELIDGKASKVYAYTGNGLTLRFREEGTHSVEMKAYNANGISLGSKMVSFTLNQTYRDPFDPTPYMKKMDGEWMWNSDVDGHFGCGPDTSNPAGWWAAKANEKADWSLYNDRMTFTADGKYTFNPGDDGKVYVNAGFTSMGGPQDADFLVDIPEYTTEYTISNNWNEAGIEEIWLTLPSQKNLSYIPNDYIYKDPRFLVLESSKKVLKLAAANAPNGDGTISWLYSFVPAVKMVTPEELLAGTDGKGKVWVMDSDAKGHLACGPSPEEPAGWWAAGANEKAGFGMYDDEITFYPDGKYVYSAGADGKLYINKDVTVIGPGSPASEDIDIDWTTTESSYTFDGENLVLAANSPMVYVHSNSMYENPVYRVTAISETSLTVVAMNEGCYWQMIFKARDVQVASGPQINGTVLPAEFSFTQGEVLNVADINLAEIWVDPDYFSAAGATSLKFNAVSGDYKVYYDADAKWLKVVPLVDGEFATYDNGKALWIIGDSAGKPDVNHLIGWTPGNALPMARINDNTYRITLAVDVAKGSFKIFGQANWGREFTHTEHTTLDLGPFHVTTGTGDGDPGNIYANSGTPSGLYTMTVVDNDGILTASVNAYSDPFDPASERNLWNTATIEEMFYYYAPGWAQIANPEVEQDGNKYTISLPEATTDQWQAQVAFRTNLSSSADKLYDFACVLNCNNDHNGVTVKLVQTGNDEVFYFADRHVLQADTDYVYRVSGMQGIDIEKISLFFDFGGNAAGTKVVIRDIIFQEHVD